MRFPIGTIQRRANAITSSLGEKMMTFSELKHKSSCILFKARSAFPFDIFPNDIIVDSEKVNVILRLFFGSQQIHSIPIKNISDLSVEHSIFFATLHILPGRVFENQVVSIDKLKRSDAIKARNIIQGLVIADRENVEIENLIHTENGIDELESLGKPI
ncbi:MAG TPA: hypothetical protein VF189_06175 [Patescibacteria group bacterium]